jgi:alanine-glyoxylate transaminase/(R)-3-amino-2-methylpropionate-pyruvate transaminase
VIPDIVTMAKGIGNGVPLAAVVTTPEIAAVLSRRIHFNTFGGNPVSCAAGMAVLEVIDRDNLQKNALERGRELMEGYRKLMARHEIIGDVRGRGLMTGIELVQDRRTKEPAREACLRIFERLKDLGLLVGKGGLHSNTLRIKPPLCITREDVAFLLEVLDLAIGEL